MAAIHPTAARRRSFVYRKLLETGVTFESLGDGAVVAGPSGAYDDAVAPLAIHDLSGLPRIGFKGREALDWLRGRGLDCGDTPNRAYLQADGVLIAILASTEALLLSPIAEPVLTLTDLADACSLDDDVRCYPVLRADSTFEFLVGGEEAATMFSKICAVDLRTSVFDVGTVAQTSLARSNAIIVRVDSAAAPIYRVLGDSASAEYMWESLLDAMAEFGGGSHD